MILIAHDSEPIREVIRTLVGGAGWRVETVGDGEAARAALVRQPAALVLDVALSGVMAYQLIEEARRQQPGLRVLLVASIYNRTGYKRRPTSLYGADDYIEQHHIPDSLVAKLSRLVGAPPVHTPAPVAHGDTEEGRAIREASLQASGDLPVRPAYTVERAERLARLIVTDIALYNGDALDRAVSDGNTDELDARLRMDIEEGRLLFDMRVPEMIRRQRDFVGAALAELISERRRALRKS
jgi:CheY-like chemotaxis protein